MTENKDTSSEYFTLCLYRAANNFMEVVVFGAERLETIKDALHTILRDSNSITVERLVDPGCSLRSIKTFLTELDEAWSNRIKQHCEDKGNDVLQGDNFQAERKEIVKTCIDAEKVKAVLGRRLPQVQTKRTEVHLKYKPRF